jgi:hypothetical protein
MRDRNDSLRILQSLNRPSRLSFEHFYTFSDDCDVWVKVDEKNKIVGIKIGEQR